MPAVRQHRHGVEPPPAGDLHHHHDGREPHRAPYAWLRPADCRNRSAASGNGDLDRSSATRVAELRIDGHPRQARQWLAAHKPIYTSPTHGNREVLRMGDARLLQVSGPVRDFQSPELNQLLADMRDTHAGPRWRGHRGPADRRALCRSVIFGMHAQSALSGCGTCTADRADQSADRTTRRRHRGWLGRMSFGAGHARTRAAFHAGCGTPASTRRRTPIDRTVTGFQRASFSTRWIT